DQAPYWFDKSTPKWFEMVDANITPRVSVFSFTGNDLVNSLNYQGDYARFIKSPLFKDPISNIPGVELTTSAGYYAVKLPRVAATYTIEVSLNMTTAPTPGKNYAYNATQECVGYGGPASGKQECSKDMNAAGYNMMGYFLEMGVLYASIGYQNADGSNARIRKESPVVDKIGGRHSVSWSTTIKVTPRTDNTADPVVEFMLGRMDRSTYFLPATVIGDGSFIKIQQLK
ncbi:MAG: hypothetical protein Q4C75_03550, partial [Bergeyella zoohelcum]|nr:hypothetical protein [Bergeyella zoohelcum]